MRERCRSGGVSRDVMGEGVSRLRGLRGEEWMGMMGMRWRRGWSCRGKGNVW